MRSIALLAAMMLIASQDAVAFLMPQSSLAGAVSTVSTSNCAATTTSLRMSTVEEVAEGEEDGDPQVYFASEVAEDNKKQKFRMKFGDKGVKSTKETAISAKHKGLEYGAKTYEGLTDGDTFDGGDGQTGVVGDGTLNLDDFTKYGVTESQEAKARLDATTMVKESKARQMNAFGTFTGYAEELKKQGLQEVDEYGEDKKAVRRQQFENWRNQQNLQEAQRKRIAQDEIYTGTGTGEGIAHKVGANKSYFNNLKNAPAAEDPGQAWNTFSAKHTTGKADGTSWGEVVLGPNEKIHETIQCVSLSGRPGSTTIEVRNSVMGFEPFHCAFLGENIQGFTANPMEGTLNGRKGAPTPILVSFKGNAPGDARVATFVVETEEDKWIYKVEGTSE